MPSPVGRDGRLKRIARLDILPIKPHQGWNDLQIDEALRRPELFRGDRELYAAVRREAIKRGLGGEEDYAVSPFRGTDMADEAAEVKLPFLMEEDRQRQKHERKERRKRLMRLLMEVGAPQKGKEKGERKAAPLDRLLRLAAAMGDAGADTWAIDRQLGLYLRRAAERGTPPMWRRNADYSPEEGSPYLGSAAEFLGRFPGGIAEWRERRRRIRADRERRSRIAVLMPDAPGDDGLDSFLMEAWKREGEAGVALAHFVPEGGDDVAKLGDREPKLWSDEPKWKGIGEFLEAHREHYGRDADDAALRAARDFVKYWKLTTRKPKGAKGK